MLQDTSGELENKISTGPWMIINNIQSYHFYWKFCCKNLQWIQLVNFTLLVQLILSPRLSSWIVAAEIAAIPTQTLFLQFCWIDSASAIFWPTSTPEPPRFCTRQCHRSGRRRRWSFHHTRTRLLNCNFSNWRFVKCCAYLISFLPPAVTFLTLALRSAAWCVPARGAGLYLVLHLHSLWFTKTLGFRKRGSSRDISSQFQKFLLQL